MSTDIYPTKDDHSEELLKLMIKKHMRVGIKYLCKTSKEDHNKYPGSGTVWKEILKEHGKEHVKTKVIFTSHSKSEFKKVAIMLSEKWDIVESKDWANKIKENGFGGGGPASEETKQKISDFQLKRYEDSKERKKTSDAILKAHEENPEIKERKSAAQLKHHAEHPERAEASSKSLSEVERTDEWCKNIAAAQTERWKDPKERERQSAALTKYNEDPKNRERNREAQLKYNKEHPEKAQEHSDALKKFYDDPEKRAERSRSQANVLSNKRAAKSVEFVDVLREACRNHK
jgi:hypothetical protein